MKKLFLSVVVPILVLGGVEGVLALLGIAKIPPLFVRKATPDGTVACTNQESAFWSKPFIEACVSERKPPGTYRIFVIGESTPNGFPFTRHCTPARWLQVRLEQLFPQRAIEVVRLASNGKVASELVDLADEILAWDPDLIVTYVGHNEFILVSIPEIKHPTQFRIRQVALGSRIGRVLSGWITGQREPPPDELPDTRLIADQPYLSPEEFAYGQDRYRRALDAVREKCRAHGTQLLICLPACNLKDYPPTYSSFAAATPAADRDRVRQLVESGIEREQQGDLAGARPLLEEALRIDAQPAIAHYHLGETLLHLDGARALHEFELARDLDMYPNRAQQPLLDIIREQGRRGALIADCVAEFNRAAQDGVPGVDLFVDHCHPEITAQSLIATSVMRAMAEANLIAPRSEWRFDAEPDVAEYHRRLQLKFPDIASDFSASAINALLHRLGSATRRTPAAEAAAKTCAFALRYDAGNGTARLGQALSAFVLGRKDEARQLAADAIARDPRLRFYRKQLPSQYPEFRELFEP